MSLSSEFPIYRSPLLEQLGCMSHGLSGRQLGCPEDRFDGNMSFSWGNLAAASRWRSEFATRIGVAERPTILPRQVHGSDVLAVERLDLVLKKENPFIAEADGLVTARYDVVLGILVADCIPIFLFDSKTPAIGLIHAGWRGTLAGIAKRALAVMKEQWGTQPEHCFAWIGPSIGVCCFEVGAEVTQAFSEGLPKLGMAFGDHIDLKQVNRRLLLAEGVPDAQIEISPACTYCNDGFFSHRRAVHRGLPRTGRMMGLMALRTPSERREGD